MQDLRNLKKTLHLSPKGTCALTIKLFKLEKDIIGITGIGITFFS